MYDNLLVLGSGLETRTSNIPGAGLGLFTTTSINRGTMITEYQGEVIGHEEACKRRSRSEATHIRVALTHMLYIDGLRGTDAPAGSGGGSLINCVHGTRIKKNCAFYSSTDPSRGNRVFARAVRDIAAGDELLSNYGRGYWDLQNISHPH